MNSKAQTTAAPYEGEDAASLMEGLEERLLNVDITPFNQSCRNSIPHQSRAEFVDRVESQAKVLENLGQEVSEDDTLTRLKEGLTDKRYSRGNRHAMVHAVYIISMLLTKTDKAYISPHEYIMVSQLIPESSGSGAARRGSSSPRSSAARSRRRRASLVIMV